MKKEKENQNKELNNLQSHEGILKKDVFYTDGSHYYKVSTGKIIQVYPKKWPNSKPSIQEIYKESFLKYKRDERYPMRKISKEKYDEILIETIDHLIL